MCAYFWVLPLIPVHAEQDYSPQEKRYSELHGVFIPTRAICHFFKNKRHTDRL